MSEVTREEFDSLAQQVGALAARVNAMTSTGAVTAPAPDWFDLQPDGTVRLAAYENLSAEDKATIEAYRARFETDPNLLGNMCGPRFMWGRVAYASEPNEFQRKVIKRSCAGAGTLELNNGRWCYANLTDDTKLHGATAIREDEDPATVIQSLIGYMRRDLAVMAYTPTYF